MVGRSSVYMRGGRGGGCGGQDGCRRLLVATMLILIAMSSWRPAVSAAGAAASDADGAPAASGVSKGVDEQAPCKLDAINDYLAPGNRWHEYKEGYKARNQSDLRSHEEEVLLKDGIGCVDRRLSAVAAAVDRNNDLLEKRRDELRTLLQDASATLSAVSAEAKTLSSIKVDVTLHGDGKDGGKEDTGSALEQRIIDTLVAQNKTLRKIEQEIGSSGGVAAAHVTAVALSSSTSVESRADSAPRDQIDPTVSARTYYDKGTTSFDFAIASIPDPRVPRHRRQYDNAIVAISQGMLADEFVLDKYAFPWAKDLLPSVGTETKSNSEPEPKIVDDDRYGLMLFRHDVWRKGSNAVPLHYVEVRALYLVPETATYGLQPKSLTSAITAIDKDWTAPDPTEAKALVLFGPTLSGSMNSIREVVLTMGREGSPGGKLSNIRWLHLVSPSATVDSNRDMVDVTRAPSLVSYYTTLARSDAEKLKAIDGIRNALGVKSESVAIVYESTTFGIEACKDPEKVSGELPICAGALKVPLPVNIADVRYGLRQKAAVKASDSGLQDLLPGEAMHLSLEQGAENGSEFPESQQSPITAASTELELQRLIATLSAKHAKLVIVIATDVRDRLFLIEQIAASLDGALYVDLGADRLLGHPDFIHATRGMLTLSSSRLTRLPLDQKLHPDACFKGKPFRYSVWSTDEQAALACAISAWTELAAAEIKPTLTPYVVSRKGLVSSDDPPANRLRLASVVVTTALCIIFSLAGIWMAFRRREPPASTEGSANQLEATAAGPLAGFLGLTIIVMAVIWVSVGSLGLALLVGVILYCYIYWSRKVTFRWSTAMVWISTLFLSATAVSELIWGAQWASNCVFSGDDWATQWRELLASLSQAIAGGLAYPAAECVAVASMFTTVWICRRIVQHSERTARVVRLAAGQVVRDRLERPTHHAGLVVASLTGAAVSLAVISFWMFDARQVTVFGRLADFSIFVGLVATTLLAFCMLVGALSAGMRIGTLCDLIKGCLRAHHGIDADRAKGIEQQPLLWTELSEERAHFVATPVMANRWTGRAAIEACAADETQWAGHLRQLLMTRPVRAAGLKAVNALLSSEMANYQFAILGVALATVASSGIVYLYPVTSATVLIGLNLVALLIAGVYSAFKTLKFEGDIVLSNVLCNRSQKKKWSLSLFIFIVIPFLVMAVALGIQQIPGVLSVGNGLLDALLKWVKPGG